MSPATRRRTASASPAPSSRRPRPHDPVVLYFHGNAEAAAQNLPLAESLHARGLGVFLAEYRGYGGLGGSPSEKGLYADGEAALAELGRLGVTRRSGSSSWAARSGRASPSSSRRATASPRSRSCRPTRRSSTWGESSPARSRRCSSATASIRSRRSRGSLRPSSCCTGPATTSSPWRWAGASPPRGPTRAGSSCPRRRTTTSPGSRSSSPARSRASSRRRRAAAQP